jgi:hypothetical protein
MSEPINAEATKTADPVQLSLTGELTLRVRPATFARMLGVSRAAVHAAIRDKRVTLGKDGRLNPHTAADQWARNTNPRRVRQVIGRSVSGSVDALAAELERTRAELRHAKARQLREDDVLTELRRQLDAVTERLQRHQADRLKAVADVLTLASLRLATAPPWRIAEALASGLLVKAAVRALKRVRTPAGDALADLLKAEALDTLRDRIRATRARSVPKPKAEAFSPPDLEGMKG